MSNNTPAPGSTVPGSTKSVKVLVDHIASNWRIVSPNTSIRDTIMDYLSKVNRFSPQASKVLSNDGKTLALLIYLNGARWYNGSFTENPLILAASKGLNTSIPSSDGRIASVEAWGDLDMINVSRVKEIRTVGVDFSTYITDSYWSVLSLRTEGDFPVSRDVVEAIRSGVLEDVKKLPPDKARKTLIALRKGATEEHHAWLDEQTLKQALPPLSTRSSFSKKRI